MGQAQVMIGVSLQGVSLQGVSLEGVSLQGVSSSSPARAGKQSFMVGPRCDS